MSGLDATVEVRAGPTSVSARLSVASGETVAVVGPNGAGKTTLLHAIAGLLPLDAGRVRLAEELIDDPAAGVRLPAHRRRIGVVFQDLRLFDHLSVCANVAFGLRAAGMARRDAERAALEWLDRFGLAGRARARPAALSGGEAQRVALARALAPRPRLLLLDEPFAAVDPAARPALRRDVLGGVADSPAPRVVVTHDPVEALSLADRVVVVEAGRVTQDGTPAEIAVRPRSAYVADLLGVNLIRGRASGGVVRPTAGGSLVAAGAPDGDVFALVHPRAVALHRTPPDGTPRNVWQARVVTADAERGRVRIRVDGVVPLVAEVTAAAYAELGLEPGRPVWVAVKATEVSAYPA